MRKEAVIIELLLLFSFAVITTLTLLVEAAPGTVRVPQDFPTIQQAIDASSSGGTILVAPGTYNENITILKPLTIKGENRSSTIMEQAGAFAVCHVAADNVHLVGFTVRGGSIGVWIDYCNFVIITSTVITNNDDGMWATFSYGSVISDNILADNLFMGLYLEASNNTSIDGNTMATNTYGIYMQDSEGNSICSNNVSLNYADGIDFINSDHNALFHNIISNNSLGIYLEGSNSNSIYENNLVDNLDQAWAESLITNTWDDGTHGNYWSNYTGTDNNGDGIGDTPYIINPNNQDRFPLMKPWTNILVINISPSKTSFPPGPTIKISVSLQNQGWSAETTNITVFANTTTIGTYTNMAILSRDSTTLNFTWNTTGLAKGNYNITANADPVQGETDTADNTLTYIKIVITIEGDINGDNTVDIFDAIELSAAYSATPTSPNWNANADINSDNIVDLFDAIILAGNYGKSS